MFLSLALLCLVNVWNKKVQIPLSTSIHPFCCLISMHHCLFFSLQRVSLLYFVSQPLDCLRDSITSRQSFTSPFLLPFFSAYSHEQTYSTFKTLPLTPNLPLTMPYLIVSFLRKVYFLRVTWTPVVPGLRFKRSTGCCPWSLAPEAKA